jgi:hypothetical protein
MFIDTATANTRSLRPQVIISPSPYNDGSTPLLETAVGQDVPPPSYLEATTPGLFTSRMSGEEGARLLSLDGREARDVAYKEEQYGRRSLRQRCLRKPWRKLVVSVLVVMFLAVMLALMLAAVSARRDKLVRSLVNNEKIQANMYEGYGDRPFAFSTIRRGRHSASGRFYRR